MPNPEIAALERVNFNWVTSLDSVWSDEPPSEPDESENCSEVFRLIKSDLKAIEFSQDMDSPLGRIILGDGGAGKTYLARLLHSRVLSDGHQFVTVDCTDIRDFWETVLHSYIRSLQRPFGGKSQLELLLGYLWGTVRVKIPEQYFQDVAKMEGSSVLQHTEQLLHAIGPLLSEAKQRLGSQIAIQVIRSLYLLNSSDERLNDLGNNWLLGLELESSEASELKLNNVSGQVHTKAAIVKALSWLMAKRGPTLLIFDQLDPIIAESHAAGGAATEHAATSKYIIEGLGAGLSKIYDNTTRTLSVILAFEGSWAILQTTTLNSNLGRYHSPRRLFPVTSTEAIEKLVKIRLNKVYQSVGFNPSYPTYPYPKSSLTGLANLGIYPRQILQKLAIHRENCLREGKVSEFFLDTPPPPPPPPVNFTKKLEEKVKAADVASLLKEENEDKLGDILVCLCEGVALEMGNNQDVTFESNADFKGGSYPSLHARLRKIEHTLNDREEHFCLRVLQKTNAAAFKARLGAAMTEAGIDNSLPFRRLIIFRGEPIPGGAKTKEVFDKFTKAEGKLLKINEADLKVVVAVKDFLKSRPVGFESWLAQARPLSKLDLVKQTFAGLYQTVPTAVKPPPVVETAVTPPTESKKIVQATVVQPTESSTFPLGRKIVGGNLGDEVLLPDVALTKHVVIRAGSGGGKTVLVKRLIEEAALNGIPAIVLDPGNDLGWLGDPWATAPPSWTEADVRKAKAYFKKIEVVVWTPGKISGRNLSLRVLPDMKSVVDDVDSLNGLVELALESLSPLCISGANKQLKKGVLAAALRAFAQHGGNLNSFIDFLDELPHEATGGISQGTVYGSQMANLLRAAISSNPLLKEAGQVIDINVLFGIGRAKTRISVINFVGLPSPESQQHFVNQLAMTLFSWVKQNPSMGPNGVTGLFVIDEAKPYIPSVGTVPTCKKSLMSLAAQARKYGLGMILATQNPKEIDYNAVANFGTQYFGRANAPQVIEYIDTMLQAKGGSGDGVARLQRGQFYVTSSEGLAHPVKIQSPLCLSNHPDGRPLTAPEIIAKANLPIAK